MNTKPPSEWTRGEMVYDRTDCNSKGEPTYKKLWIWETRYDPSYPPKSRGDSVGDRLYSVKDGPGEKANFVGGWVRERDLYEDFPKEEESLIDM